MSFANPSAAPPSSSAHSHKAHSTSSKDGSLAASSTASMHGGASGSASAAAAAAAASAGLGASGRQPRRIFVGGVITPLSALELRVLERCALGVGSGGVIRFVEDLSAVEDELRAAAGAAQSGNGALNGANANGAAQDTEGSTTEEEDERGAQRRRQRTATATATAVSGATSSASSTQLQPPAPAGSAAAAASGAPAARAVPIPGAARGSPEAQAAAGARPLPDESTLSSEGTLSSESSEASQLAASSSAGSSLASSAASASVDAPATAQNGAPQLPPASVPAPAPTAGGAPGRPRASGISEAALLESALVSRVAARHGWKQGTYRVVRLDKGEFLLPGFVDTHTHACQVPNAGLGQQYELLDWLNNVTFPRERKFEDASYARRTYSSVVQRLIDCGTTTACYYATLHLEASCALADICHEKGQRAFVGKCQMDRNGGAGYVEKSASQSVQDTKDFVEHCRKLAAGPTAAASNLAAALAVAAAAAATANANGSAGDGSQVPASAPLHRGLSQRSDRTDETDFSSVSAGAISSQGGGKPPSTNTSPTSATASTGLAAALRQRSLQRGGGGSARGASLGASGTATPSSHATARARERERERELSHALVQPILTPRFAIACTDALLAGIAALQSRDPTLRVQTHLSENPSEISFTKSLFPFAQNYTSVYDHFALLGPRTILAHAIHLEDEEMELIAQRGCGISHCPTSNLNIRSGCSRVGEMLNRGIKVGLGTDVSGGFALSMLSAIRDASVVAKVLAMTPAQIGQKELPPASDQPAAKKSYENKYAHDFTQGPLPTATLLFLATLGGAQVCALENRIGSLEPGKDFDALLIRTTATWSEQRGYTGCPGMYVEPEDGLHELLEKLLFTGDDRSIAQVFVRGRRIDSGAFFET